jgi:23S rRNA-/tRNA-specific pseudouridylate synthase
MVVQDLTLQQLLGDPESGIELSRLVHAEQRFRYTRPIVAGDELTGVMGLKMTSAMEAYGDAGVRAVKKIQIAEARALVIRETPSAIVLNKPPGLATQGGSKTTKHVDGLLDAFVTDDRTPRPRLVHRLDKDTSGVLLIARTPGSAASFSKRFASRSARKVYWALVVGVPQLAEGVIDAPLAKQPGTGGEKMHVDEEAGAAAKTRYRVVDHAGQRLAAAIGEAEFGAGAVHFFSLTG